MRPLHCSCLLAGLLAVAPAATAQRPADEGETFGYVVFLRGTSVGREEVTTRVTPEGINISGRGRLAPPLDIVTSRIEVRYRTDWSPESLSIQGTIGGGAVSLNTTFTDGEARSESVEGGQTTNKVDKVSPQTIVVPNLFFGTYEALARR